MCIFILLKMIIQLKLWNTELKRSRRREGKNKVTFSVKKFASTKHRLCFWIIVKNCLCKFLKVFSVCLRYLSNLCLQIYVSSCNYINYCNTIPIIFLKMAIIVATKKISKLLNRKYILVGHSMTIPRMWPYFPYYF